jgi:hypothetical protein
MLLVLGYSLSEERGSPKGVAKWVARACGSGSVVPNGGVIERFALTIKGPLRMRALGFLGRR